MCYIYNEPRFMLFCDNIPEPDVIFIKHKAFIVDFIPERNNEYSVFPTYRKQFKHISNYNTNIPFDGLFNFIRKFKLDKQHNEVIKEKGYDTIVKNTSNINNIEIDNIDNIDNIDIININIDINNNLIDDNENTRL